MKKHIKGRFFVSLISIFVIIIVISLCAFKTRAEEPEKNYGDKCYMSITLEPGDTLTSIANEYRCDAYDSVQEYIEEIMEINGLINDHISAGQSIVIAYYE